MLRHWSQLVPNMSADIRGYEASLHHLNDSCIKMGSDVSHFNVSLIMRDRVTRQCPQTTTFEEKGEPKHIRTEVILLTSLTPYRWAKPAHPTEMMMWGFMSSDVG